MAASMEIVHREGFTLGDLPEDCIAAILRLTSPKDVARLACVSSVFRDVSFSDAVWQKMLPPAYDDILAQAPDDAPGSTCPKKQIYDYLSERVLLQNGTQDFWLDRATGGVCRSFGARGLRIIWGDDHRYWRWTTQEGCRFAEAAYLIQVCWLEVQGNCKCSLPPGVYTLSWRFCFAREFSGFSSMPVKFSLQATGEAVHYERVLTNLIRRQWVSGHKWVEVDVGEFTVEEGDSPVELQFSMIQTDGGEWKSGVLVDSVFIRPTSVLAKQRLAEPQQEGVSSGPDDTQEMSRVEGIPGLRIMYQRWMQSGLRRGPPRGPPTR